MTAGGNRSAGFTIVETMIVLAVSAGLLIIAYAFIGGRQNSVQFQTAINNQKQFLEQTINETANGYYPYGQNITCVGDSTGGFPNVSIGGAVQQGQHNSCTFLGKVITYGYTDNSASYVIPMIGNQQTGTLDATSLYYAHPLALGGGTNPVDGVSTLPNFSTRNNLDNGLKFCRVSYIYSTGGNAYNPVASACSGAAAIAVLYDVSAYSFDSNNNLNSGSQRLTIYGFVGGAGIPVATSVITMSNYLNNKAINSVPPTHPNPGPDPSRNLNEVDLCFKSGSTNQYAILAITGNGNLGVTETIQGTPCY